MAAHVYPRRVTSTPTTITVSSTWTPPYSLPASGQAVAIGTTTGAGIADGIAPSSHNTTQWRYSLFESFGGGCYIEDYSDGGGYVLCGTGGHVSPPNFGAAIFDFTDALWKRVDNTNGMPWRANDITVGETSGSPNYSIAIGGVEANSMPAPPHTYMHVLPISTANGGGAKGSVVHVICSAQTTAPVGGVRSYRFDLNSGHWSMLSTNLVSDVIALGSIGVEAPAIYNPATNRYYQFPNQIHQTNPLAYLDGADWTWKALPTMTNAPQTVQNQTGFLDPARGWALVMSSSDNVIRRLDLSNVADGWRNLNKSGTVPEMNRWEYYPIDGCFYTYTGTSGQNIHKLTPPGGDPLTGTWAISTVTIGGATIPVQQNEHGVRHYTRFFYVPILQCFAWIAGGANRTVLIKP